MVPPRSRRVIARSLIASSARVVPLHRRCACGPTALAQSHSALSHRFVRTRGTTASSLRVWSLAGNAGSRARRATGFPDHGNHGRYLFLMVTRRQCWQPSSTGDRLSRPWKSWALPVSHGDSPARIVRIPHQQHRNVVCRTASRRAQGSNRCQGIVRIPHQQHRNVVCRTASRRAQGSNRCQGIVRSHDSDAQRTTSRSDPFPRGATLIEIETQLATIRTPRELPLGVIHFPVGRH